MEKTMVIQGRSITKPDIALIERLLSKNPSWGRKRLSVELCSIWHWHNGMGQVKDMACRSMLLKLGHPIYLLETFVDRSRFRGTCYKAANWRMVGETKGRTRNDRNNTIHVPVKDVYVYSLRRDFRRRLCRKSTAGTRSGCPARVREGYLNSYT